MRLGTALRAACWVLHAATAAAQPAPSPQAPPAPPTIVDVRIEQEGQPVTERLVTGLVETRAGEPLSIRDVRETITHLTGLGRYDDVQVFQEPAPGGVRLRYVLVPIHAVDRVEFRGELRIDEDDLRRAMTERYGETPPAGRAADVARLLQALYRDRGYVQAAVEPRIVEQHDPDRATLIFDIVTGARTAIRSIDVEGLDAAERSGLLEALGVRAGEPYDSDRIRSRLDRYEARLRSRGYYEARATHGVDFTPEGAAVDIAVERGPRVTVTFAGDALPENAERDLVPVQREGSADEDLLEDANRAIEEYLHLRGYRDAQSAYTRDEQNGELRIVFTVNRGARHVVDSVALKGNTAVPAGELLPAVDFSEGDAFVQASLDAAAARLRDVYRQRGFTRALVEPQASVLPPSGGERRVAVSLAVVEGPQTIVSSIALEGNTVLSEGRLRSVMQTAPGSAYSQTQVASDRDRIQLEYLNRGYETAVVDPHATLTENDTRADVRFVISEGPQVLVDEIIIIGNERTRTDTIARELMLKPGEPLGYAALIESQQRLSALGLFRRVRIEQLRHGTEPRRDILVRVEEAPPTTIGYGGGLEGARRLRSTGQGGTAEERFELAPRGFFEIGRRNLWGKNRAVNLFTRVSLRTRDVVVDDEGVRFETPEDDYGPNEYRVYATYREPRILNTPVDVLVTGILDQAIRTSFNFITREARAEFGVRVSQRYSLAGRYSYEHTRLFDVNLSEEDRPLIDRLFPQVRLSMFSTTGIRDTRNDVLNPDRGTFAAVEADLAARVLGSEVGFVRSYIQGFTYRRLPARRPIVLALAARVGAAQGFRRQVARTDAEGRPVRGPNGEPVVDVVQDLPASERFFAGGDTTVRGFSLDRLGNAETITPTGFPRGGNGLIVLNAELRMRLFGGLDGVGFVDAGNVFPRASELQLTDLRPAAGFGFRYRSPVGPLRVDWGFNLDRRELVPGRLERRSVLHISLGQAF